jgi:predicted MFS family arabinose efflux permease
VIGPTLGGIALTALGAAWCFTFNGLSFIAVIISLLLLPMRPVPARSGASIITSLREGLEFVWRQGSITALIVLAFAMTTLGIPLIVFLPVVVRDVFEMGPQTFTLLLVISGAGAVAGALAVAAFGHVHHKGRITLLALISLGIFMGAFGFSKSLVLSCVFLFVAGAALIAVLAMISSLVQLIAPDEMRGRVMSVYNVAFRGGMPIGSLISGALIPKLSVGVVLASNGALLVALGAYFLLMQRRVARL